MDDNKALTKKDLSDIMRIVFNLDYNKIVKRNGHKSKGKIRTICSKRFLVKGVKKYI